MLSAYSLLLKRGFIFTFNWLCKWWRFMRLCIFVKFVDWFLRGKQNHIYQTVTHHNTKSSRYQLYLGGNNYKTIVIYLIDSGLLNNSEIVHGLSIPADFSRDYLVLHIYSVYTVHDILALEYAHPHLQIILRCTLLFMQTHLSSVNKRGG